MVLDNTSPYADNALFDSTDTDDFNLIFAYLNNTTTNKVFSGVSDADIATHLTTIRNGSNINSSLTALTNGYDAGDQLIGNNIDYIMIEMNASVS